MPRLRNAKTGVIVNVDESTAAQLGDDWSAADAKAQSPVAETEAEEVPEEKPTARGKATTK